MTGKNRVLPYLRDFRHTRSVFKLKRSRRLRFAPFLRLVFLNAACLHRCPPVRAWKKRTWGEKCGKPVVHQVIERSGNFLLSVQVGCWFILCLFYRFSGRWITVRKNINVDVNVDAIDGIFAEISTWEKLMWRWCFNVSLRAKGNDNFLSNV